MFVCGHRVRHCLVYQFIIFQSAKSWTKDVDKCMIIAMCVVVEPKCEERCVGPHTISL